MGSYFDTLRELVTGREERADGWLNPSTGLGTSMDRATGTFFLPDYWLDMGTLASLYHHNDIAERACSLFPKEALRRKWEMQGPRAAELRHDQDRIDLRKKIRRGATWGRTFGGGLGVLWVEDGRSPDQPVDRTKGHAIRDLTVYDRRSVEREVLYDEPGDQLYAHAKMFRVMPAYGGQFKVHRDRCLVFGGVETADYEREALQGWDASVLQRMYNVIAGFESAYMALSNLLTDASQPVISISGLVKALGQKGGKEAITKRAQIINLTRSIARAMFLDADAGEKFERVNAQFSGIPESIDRFGNRLAMATEMPVTILLGQAPAGLNATGESDIRSFYATTTSYRSDDIEPHVDRVIQIMAPGHENKAIWPTLWEPTDKEQAETRLALANADIAYLDRDVYTPEEVAAVRGKPTDVKPNMRLRKALRAPTPAAPALPAGVPLGAGGGNGGASKPTAAAPSGAADRGHPDRQGDDGPRQ